MKKIVLLFIAGMMSLNISAQEKKAGIQFEQEVVDYGEVGYGEDGIRKFKFTNTGDDVLIIARVYSPCGCTVPTKPEKPILPGETGEIAVKYDTKKVGPIRKTISVYTNASEIPHPLKIKGTVLPEAQTDGK